jgi:hypothetical protein
MIVFNLSCDNRHQFEGWFASASAFEFQRDAMQLSCPVCGSDQVSKELHAPYVNTGTPRQPAKPAGASREVAQQAVFGKAVAQLVNHVLANTEDVGEAFPEEARKIHYQEAPERAIRGHATLDEVAELRDEGIEVVALPIPKHRVGNQH